MEPFSGARHPSGRKLSQPALKGFCTVGNCLGRYDPPPATAVRPARRDPTAPAAALTDRPIAIPASPARSTGPITNVHPQTRLLLRAWRDIGGDDGGDRAEAVRRLDAMTARDGRTLDWSGLGLTSLPECIGHFVAIRQLNIARNVLTVLPDSITQLRKLQRLNLEGNQLTGLPAQLHRLGALRELRLCNNRLTNGGTDFSGMSGLLELHLARNALSLTPADLGNLGPTTLIHAQHNLPDGAGPSHASPQPTIYHASELDQALADDAGDPLTLRAPDRAIQLLLEAASELTSSRNTGRQRIRVGNRNLTRKDCLLMALELALEHQRDLLPVISHHLLHEVSHDMARFEVLGSTLAREKILAWAQRRDLPVAVLVDETTVDVGNQMPRMDGQNVHAGVVVIAGVRALERIRKLVPTPLSQDRAQAQLVQYLSRTGTPATALRGLDLVMKRKQELDHFKASPADTMALLWTYISNTKEQPLRDNLLNAMQNRLSEITVDVCATGMVQRIIDIPSGIDFSLTGAISREQLRDELRRLAGTVNDEFENRQSKAPVQETSARPIDLSLNRLLGTMAVAPADDAATRQLLIKGIESRAGIYEFIPQRRPGHPANSTSKSVITTLMDALALPAGETSLGDRYQVTAIEPCDDVDAAEKRDHLHVRMTVHDRQTNALHRIPMTQVGLKLTDRLLRSAEIERANVLLDQHLTQITDAGYRGQWPLLVTASGKGRNLLLRAYRELRHGIRDGVIRDAAEIDTALTLFADNSEQVRGKNNGFSDAQIAELRVPLLDALAARDNARQEQVDVENSGFKRAMFRQRAHLELVLLRGIDPDLVAAETEQVFPVGVVV
jgi:hypothetical protein